MDKLTKEEQEIEQDLENGKYENVENFEEWKNILNAAAKKTLSRIENNRLIADFSTPDLKEKAVKLLKERFGNEIELK